MRDVLTVLGALGFEMIPAADPSRGGVSRSPAAVGRSVSHSPRQQGKKRRFQSRSPSPSMRRREPHEQPSRTVTYQPVAPSPRTVSLADHVTAAFALDTREFPSLPPSPSPSPRQKKAAPQSGSSPSPTPRAPSPRGDNQGSGHGKKDAEFERQLTSFVRKSGGSVSLDGVSKVETLICHKPGDVSLVSWLRRRGPLYVLDGSQLSLREERGRGMGNQVKGFAATKFR